jgi:hypothetical protein
VSGALDRLVLRAREALPTAAPLLPSHYGPGFNEASGHSDVSGFTEVTETRQVSTPDAPRRQARPAPPATRADRSPPTANSREDAAQPPAPIRETPATTHTTSTRDSSVRLTVPERDPLEETSIEPFGRTSGVPAPVDVAAPQAPPLHQAPVDKPARQALSGSPEFTRAAPLATAAHPMDEPVPWRSPPTRMPQAPPADTADPGAPAPTYAAPVRPAASPDMPARPEPPSRRAPPPDIHVTIGRLDIHPPHPPPAPSRPRPPVRPGISLQEYQRQRRERLR